MNDKMKQTKENIKKLFAEHPELKQAFKESLSEMKKPENVKTLADNACKVFNALIALRDNK